MDWNRILISMDIEKAVDYAKEKAEEYILKKFLNLLADILDRILPSWLFGQKFGKKEKFILSWTDVISGLYNVAFVILVIAYVTGSGSPSASGNNQGNSEISHRERRLNVEENLLSAFIPETIEDAFENSMISFRLDTSTSINSTIIPTSLPTILPSKYPTLVPSIYPTQPSSQPT